MAEISPAFTELIADRYMKPMHGIHEKKIIIDNTNTKQIVISDSILIGDYEISLKFLRLFGRLITRIEFNGGTFQSYEIMAIGHSIAHYCCNSLVELEVNHVGNYLISDTSRIFLKVTTLSLWMHKYSDNFQLNRIYPMLETLSFTGDSIKYKSLTHQYAHLKKLRVELFSSRSHDSALEDLLRENLQIRSLHLTTLPGVDLLHFISNHLRNLDSLAVETTAYGFPNSSNSNDNGQIIHFASVNKFRIEIKGRARSPPQEFPITFQHLESCEIIATSLNGIPKKLIEQNIGLKSLSISTTSDSDTFAQILSFLEFSLLELKEINVNWSSKVLEEETLRLMTQFDKLQKIRFIVWDEPNRIALMRIIPANWEVTNSHVERVLSFNVFHITFERNEFK